MFVLYQEKGSPNYVREFLASRTPNSRGADLAGETGADTGMTPDSPLAEGSEDMSVTNSEVESAMNHRRWRAIL